MTRYWLMKSEPAVYGIDDLKCDKQTAWEGVRNYQARNYMRDDMKVGDLVLFYHSNAKPSGIAGIARVCKEAYPDPTAWDPKSPYYAPKTSKHNPVWMMVNVAFVEKLPNIITLDALKTDPRFKDMLVTRRGMRLSIQPVDEQHFTVIKQISHNY